MLAVIMALAVFSSCAKAPEDTTGTTAGTTAGTGDGTTSGKPTGETTTEKPADPPVKMTAAEALLSEFKRLVKANPDADTQKIADLLSTHDYLTDIDLDIYTLNYPKSYKPFIMGLKEDFEVPEYKCVTDILPMMTPNTFVAHIFELNEGTDAEEFAALLKKNADLAFNVCVVATECETGYDGNFVFFVICTEDIVKAPDQVDKTSARYIMKKLMVSVGSGMRMSTEDTDGDRSSYYFGLKDSISLVEKTGAVCEPSMLGGSSIVIVKVRDEKDCKTVADEMLAGLDPTKWICVSAETKKTDYAGGYVIGVMGSTEYCDSVIAAFHALFDGTK